MWLCSLVMLQFQLLVHSPPHLCKKEQENVSISDILLVQCSIVRLLKTMLLVQLVQTAAAQLEENMF